MPCTDSPNSQKPPNRPPRPVQGAGRGGPACLEERQSTEEGRGVREEASQAPCDQGGMVSVPGCSSAPGRDTGRWEGRAVPAHAGAGAGPTRGRGTRPGSGSGDAAVQTRMQRLGRREPCQGPRSQAPEVVPAERPRDAHPRVPGRGGGVVPLEQGGGTPGLPRTPQAGTDLWPPCRALVGGHW